MYTYLGYCTSSGKCAATPPECSDCNQYCQHYRSLLQSVALFSLNQTSISSFLLKFVFYHFVVFNPPLPPPAPLPIVIIIFSLFSYFSSPCTIHILSFLLSSLSYFLPSTPFLLFFLPSWLSSFPFFNFPFSPYSIFFLSAFSSCRLGFQYCILTYLFSSNFILPLCVCSMLYKT